MNRVRLEPLGVDIGLDDGQSLLQAAQAGGYRWPSVCGGNAECGTCFVAVIDGAAATSPVAELEERGLELVARREPNNRLACQLRVTGPVTVRKRGVRAPAPPVSASEMQSESAEQMPTEGYCSNRGGAPVA